EHAFLVGFTEAPRAQVEIDGAPALEAVAAQELLPARAVLRIAETDHVNSVGPVRSKAGFARRLGKLAACAASHPDVVHQVVTQYAARVGESVRMLQVGGVQENPHRLERLRAQDHHASVDLAGLARIPVGIENAF